jgi:integrase
VTTADLEAYREAIVADRLRRSPEKTWHHLSGVWNSCARQVEGWPSIVIERQSRRTTYVLPWCAFPLSLKDDVDCFLDRLSGRDLSDDGPLRPARLSTIKTREYQLRVAASALVQHGHDPGTLRSIADMLSFERYQQILRVLMGRHGGQTSPQVGQIAAFLKDVARHWLKADELELQRFRKIASRLAVGRRGLTTKNRERLRPFDEPDTVAAFLGLPQRIYKELKVDKQFSRRQAVLAQMAAAIALLQAAPIRLNNLTNLDLNRNLIARGKRLYLVIAETDTKNREPIDFELPLETVEILSWYVRDYRPRLLTQPTDAVFPGRAGRAKSSGALATQISKTVFKYTGLKVNVHLFRHAGGKIFLDARPGQYEIVRRVLSHRSITTTTSFYAGAETRAAGHHFAAVIAERRRALERRSPQGSRRIGDNP